MGDIGDAIGGALGISETRKQRTARHTAERLNLAQLQQQKKEFERYAKRAPVQLREYLYGRGLGDSSIATSRLAELMQNIKHGHTMTGGALQQWAANRRAASEATRFQQFQQGLGLALGVGQLTGLFGGGKGQPGVPGFYDQLGWGKDLTYSGFTRKHNRQMPSAFTGPGAGRMVY